MTPDVDAAVLQAGYTQLGARIQEVGTTSTTPATPTASASDDIPTWALYISKNGIRHDCRKAPPTTCPKCNQRHWYAGPMATPCHSSLPHRFSRSGAHSPAPGCEGALEGGQPGGELTREREWGGDTSVCDRGRWEGWARKLRGW